MSHSIRSAIAACALVLGAGQASATSGEDLAAQVGKSLGLLYQHTPSAKAMAEKAEGILVFPAVYKAGIGLGGSYGEGALVSGNKVVDYYNIIGASAGLQLGAQKQSVVVMFLTTEALQNFRKSEGWKAGVDGSIAIIETGGGKSFDSDTLQQPIIGFVFSNKGLMAGLSLEGSKLTKIKK